MRERITEALKAVIDPDLGVNIVDLGLVESIDAGPQGIQVSLIMTSPACPQGGYIAEQCEALLRHIYGAEMSIAVGVTDYPPWTPERMNEAALQQLGWTP